MNMKVPYTGRERQCPVCKKIFILHDEWVFKKKRKQQTELVFCSWKCLRKHEETALTPFEQRQKIIQAIRDGLTNPEIQALLGEYNRKIDYWRKKIEREEKEHETQGSAFEADKAGADG